jgi:oxygen-independent coproporphyrinogen-3 oxidase
MSSISHFTNIYAQNTKILTDYYKILDQGKFATHVGYRMTADDHVRKHAIMRLMCDLELDMTSVERQFGIDFESYFARALEALAPLEQDGLVERRGSRLVIVGPGRLLLRNIAMCFDAYLERLSKEKPIFSRTV